MLPYLAKFRQMGEILRWVGDGFFAIGDGEICLQNSQKWAKFKNFVKNSHFSQFLPKKWPKIQNFSNFISTNFGEFLKTPKNDVKSCSVFWPFISQFFQTLVKVFHIAIFLKKIIKFQFFQTLSHKIAIKRVEGVKK